MMSIKLFNRITGIDREDWDALVLPNRLICRHEFLQAVEESHINDCRFFYPVIYDSGRMVASTCLYFISTELDTLATGPLKLAIHGVRKFSERFLMLRSVECGTPVALGNTISLCDERLRPAVLGMIARTAEDLARRLKAGIVLLRDFEDNDTATRDSLTTLGYKSVPNLPEARLDLHWTSFDRYLDSMRSQYRCKLLAQRRKFKEAGGTLEIVDHFADYSIELAAMWRNAYDHAREYRREILLPAFFENIDRYLDNRSLVILAKLGNRPIGFLLVLLDEDVLTALFSGLDYSCHRNTGAYFNLFQKAIDMAILKNMKAVHFGITTLAPKLDLGAKAVPLRMYMKHLNPLFNMFVPNLFAAMAPDLVPEPRRVFRQ